MSLADRLRLALAADHSPLLLPGDHYDFDPEVRGNPAAVLIAVTDRPSPGVILTQRTETLRRHAGQVAFPGGRIDPGDDGPIGAALREAQEEIALPPALVEVVGTTDDYRTVTNYVVTPVIGVVPPDLLLTPSEAEVASVFEVPFDFLLDSANQRQQVTQYQGRDRHYYEILWQDRRIWGATAAMLVNLSRRLKWAA
ncbi:8-oxo-dGTP pyrophosphatase MutT (NUDIX family) [Sphingomonas kyeonggiensis]|uniref:8-oxo-dGTP pyrophosphatase MutT (NUDIX family) n=1 Tax=Sphingomonas kyeonggiensis TaxID=1268553 RepID=A0A7W7K1H8_9SPHN|nr:CoA pyrophosphatase [Sphingomonas kyeonggiensis]MBB4838645.1 8-oxo-dGTP pyrophosphatase MutT (NUDIX family) [Sphingomonas kyeonggiensis]